MSVKPLFRPPGDIRSLLEGASSPLVPSTKLACTLGPSSRDAAVLEAMLIAGMTVIRLDLSQSHDLEYHKESLALLKQAMKRTSRLCAVILDTIGPGIHVLNTLADTRIQLVQGALVELTTDRTAVACADCLPLSCASLSNLVPGNKVFLGPYLSTDSDLSLAQLTIESVQGDTATCRCDRPCTLAGDLLSAYLPLHDSDGPTLTDSDLAAIKELGSTGAIDFLALSNTRSEDDLATARAALDEAGCSGTHILAKIESMQGLSAHAEIIAAAKGVLFSRGLLGLHLHPEAMPGVQKRIVRACCMAGVPVWVTRVVDSMVEAPRPTRAEATDIANLVLDGADGIMLGAETVRGSYPVESVSTVAAICAQAELCFNNRAFYDQVMDHLGGWGLNPVMSKGEALASSAVRACEKLQGALIVVFTLTGSTAAMISKYKPRCPVLAVIEPRLSTNGVTWSVSGDMQARQMCALRGVRPIMADPSARGSTEGSMTLYALQRAVAMGLCVLGDRVVVSQCPRPGQGGQVVERGVVKICVVDESALTPLPTPPPVRVSSSNTPAQAASPPKAPRPQGAIRSRGSTRAFEVGTPTSSGVHDTTGWGESRPPPRDARPLHRIASAERVAGRGGRPSAAPSTANPIPACRADREFSYWDPFSGAPRGRSLPADVCLGDEHAAGGRDEPGASTGAAGGGPARSATDGAAPPGKVTTLASFGGDVDWAATRVPTLMDRVAVRHSSTNSRSDPRRATSPAAPGGIAAHASESELAGRTKRSWELPGAARGDWAGREGLGGPSGRGDHGVERSSAPVDLGDGGEELTGTPRMGRWGALKMRISGSKLSASDRSSASATHS